MDDTTNQNNDRLQIYPRSFHPVVYADARKSFLRTGDIALCRAGSLEGQLISFYSGSQYSHATMLGWAAADALMIAETRHHKDARLISLSGEIGQWPGYYDVYRVRRASFKADTAWSFMCHAAGAKYDFRHVTRAWLRRRLGPDYIAPIPNSDKPQWPRDCSALVHAAMRSGKGPKLKAFDCDVIPGDFADRRYFDYVCTLFSSIEQIERLSKLLENALPLSIERLKAEGG